MLKEREVQGITQQLMQQDALQQQIRELQDRNKLLESDKERIQHELSEAQSACKKVLCPEWFHVASELTGQCESSMLYGA